MLEFHPKKILTPLDPLLTIKKLRLLTMLLYVLLGIMALFVVLAGVAAAHTRRKALQAADILRRMDKRYEEYVHQILGKLPEQRDWLPTPERLAKDALTVLYADLLALWALVQTRTYTAVDLPYASNYFPTVAQWVENHLPRSRTAPILPTDQALQELREAAQETMLADLNQRLQS